jgi:hypothetical protein
MIEETLSTNNVFLSPRPLPSLDETAAIPRMLVSIKMVERLVQDLRLAHYHGHGMSTARSPQQFEGLNESTLRTGEN